MNIGLDYISESTNSAGSMTYGKYLLQELAGQYPEDNFTVFINKECRSSFEVKNENIKYIEARYPFNKRAFVRRIAQQIWLPFVAKKHKLDLLHSINNVIPFAYSGKRVITIYDMTSFVFPDRFRWAKRLYLKSFVPPSAKLADGIVTISDYAKKQIIQYCGVPEEKVEVAHCGVDDFYFDEKINDSNTEFPAEFLLFVGTLEPGKNILRLIRSFDKLTSGKHPNLKLVIAGRPGWLYEDIYAEVGKLGIKDKVVFTGRISNEDVKKAYRLAKAFIFPSLDEGFGLPVLEAMACGCPVVTSNLSALPEIAGSAALLVEPTDENQITDAIDKLLNDKELSDELRKNGIEQSEKFKWDATAKIIYELYQRILD